MVKAINILVVDGDAKILDILTDYFKFMGYSVVSVPDGMQAMHQFERHQFDILVVDASLPDGEGTDFARQAKAHTAAPILMLTDRQHLPSLEDGFGKDFEEYLLKPFSPKEILARLRAIHNRKQAGYYEKPLQLSGTVEELTVDFFHHTAQLQGKSLLLHPKEYELLAYLMRNKGATLSRKQLLSEVWGQDADGDLRTVDTHVKLLRGMLGDCRDMIQTVRGVGYRLEG